VKRAAFPVGTTARTTACFTADASHELHTPLTLIQSVGKVGLQKGGTVDEYRDVIGSVLEEVNRLASRGVESATRANACGLKEVSEYWDR
jgi:hypothetical protein